MKSLFLLLPLSFSAWHGLSAQTIRPWNEYRTILWMGGEAEKYKGEARLAERLRELGINTGMVGGGGDPKRFTDAGFGHYVENMISKGLCLKFRSNVTNWSKFVDAWKVDRSEAGLVRDYSFEDPKWRGEVMADMRKLAAHHAPFQPLMYDIRDELSTTVSANPFDYDFSPVSLAAFRGWLKTQYGSLEKLNAQWQTNFATWEHVKPFTTDQIKHRMGTGEAAPAAKVDWQAVKTAKFNRQAVQEDPARWNLAPWADHRTYMDLTLAKILGDLRDAAHEVDPHTPVGIEGTQMPHAFGGYDLWRLSQVLDWVEPYDVCNSREILGSFMPGKPMLATVFEKDTQAAQRRLWHLLLEGDKGCIIWWSEDVIDWSKPDLPLTAKGRALAPVMKSLTSPLARLFMLAERERDPIAIHYSQASIQVAWLVESLADGPTWLRRFSSYEADHNQHAVLRDAWLKAFQDQGFSPVFVSSAQIEAGALKASGARMLVLPGSRALSDKEIEGIMSFAKGPGNILCGQRLAGIFDEHGTVRKSVPRLLERFDEFPGLAPQLAASADGEDEDGGAPAATAVDPFDSSTFFKDTRVNYVSTLDSSTYVQDTRVKKVPSLLAMMLPEIFESISLVAPVQVPASEAVRVHRFKAGPHARLLAFERNIEYKMREELAQAGGNEALEKPATFKAVLKTPGHIVNLRTGEKLGHRSEIEVHLDPWQPELFAVLQNEPEDDVVKLLLGQLPGG